MEKKHDSVNVIYKISQLTLSLTDEDFEELQEMIEGQKNYFSPLKPQTMHEQHELGEHNQKMIDCLKELKQILIAGDPKVKGIAERDVYQYKINIMEEGLKANPNMRLNDNKEHVEKILDAICEKEGYCPCVLPKNEDTKCPCKKMREENKCCCKLYVER